MDGVMNILLLLTVSVSTCCCQSTYIQLFLDAKSWSEAQHFCKEQCLDLVTVSDVTVMEVLLEAFQSYNEDAMWIGLSKETSLNWRWSLADERFYKEGERTYFNWGTSNSTTPDCAYFRDELLYHDYCARSKYAVCFNESAQGAGQYVLTESQLYWHQARDFCRANYTDLASVRNAAESQVIGDAAGGEPVWIGLFRDRWAWSDNSTSSFRFFPEGTEPYTDLEPTCVAIPKNESGRWVERACNQSLPFICVCPGPEPRSSRSSVILRVALGSTGLDMNDPSAQQNIIRKMQQLLNQANLPGHASLRWVKKVKTSDEKVFKTKTAKQMKNDCPPF